MGKKSHAVSARDLLRLVRLSGELDELPLDPGLRKRHALEGLCRVVRAQVGIFAEGTGFCPGGTPVYTDAEEGGWLGIAERRVYLAYLHDEHAADPALRPANDIAGTLVTRLRRQLVTDADWYASRHVNEYRRAARVDDFVYCFHRVDDRGTVRGIGLHRPWGDARPFGERERVIVHLFYRAISRRLVPPEPLREAYRIAAKLSPRVRQVLDLLVEGLGEKEVARRLGISGHTVHGYIKSLYLQFSVESRAELIARWVYPRH